jgi:hypothetical protein
MVDLSKAAPERLPRLRPLHILQLLQPLAELHWISPFNHYLAILDT